MTDLSPGLGGGRLRPDRRLWAALSGTHDARRAEAAQTIHTQGSTDRYTTFILDAIPAAPPLTRLRLGKALSLLGDPRLSSPLYESEMIHIPTARVIIGSRAHADESPVHRVTVGAFSLAQFPVTQIAYHAFLRDTQHPPPLHWRDAAPPTDALNQPVTSVSALDAEAYTDWLSQQTGAVYRLPTEAEWTLAARGPESQRPFPWGTGFAHDRANLWSPRGPQAVCAVGLFPEGNGPYRHADLIGNVWEWTLSGYAPYPYSPFDGRDAPGDDGPRTLRGGSWRSRPNAATTASRLGEPAGDKFTFAGFRVVRETT